MKFEVDCLARERLGVFVSSYKHAGPGTTRSDTAPDWPNTTSIVHRLDPCMDSHSADRKARTYRATPKFFLKSKATL